MIPKYLKLKQQIIDDISAKKYPLFSKLPTENELANIYGVSRATVRTTLDLLVADGIIEKRWGSGNTVISTGDTAKKNTVALIITNNREYKYSTIINDVQSVLYKEGFNTEVFTTDSQLEMEREFLSSILMDTYAGVIIEPVKSALPSVNSDLLIKLMKRGTPVIFLFNPMSDIYNPITVGMDQYAGAYMATRALINMGHRQLGGIFKSDDKTGILRYSGFTDAIRDVGLPNPEFNIAWFDCREQYYVSELHDYTILNRYIKDNLPNISGVLMYSDELASIFLNLAKDAGLSCPNHFSLISFDNSDHATTSKPAISSYGPGKSIGQTAANALLGAKKGLKPDTTPIPWSFNKRETS